MHGHHELDLETLYITEPGALLSHTIRLHLTVVDRGIAPGHHHDHSVMTGTIAFDRNICQLNEWGDRTICTLMAAIPHDARATLTRTADPHAQGRHLWDLAVEGIDDMKFHLVEYPSADLWALVVSAGDKGAAVVPLFPRRLLHKP
ncbi:MAG TPA: hypothetical protein PKW35_16095 [Nannocystaceae bacterium]|nr:hypothetical protein [Nannocystaceae bacterium]